MTERDHKQTSKSIFRNVVYGSLTWILPVGLSFIATPVIVRSLGNNDFGIYALVQGVIGYSFAFNLGRAVTKYIAEYRISGESGKIRDVISASLFLNLVIGVCGVLVICLSANWLVREVFKVEPDAQNKTVIALYIASGIIFLSMLSQLVSSVLQGIQRFDVFSKIVTANSFALITGNLLFAYLGLVALLTWNLIVLVTFTAIFVFVSKRLVPEFGVRMGLERESLRLVFRYSTAIVGYQIMANLLLLFERGWITYRLGTESLTFYVVPMSVGIYMHGLISSLVLVVFPLASELGDDKERLLNLYTKATKVISVLVVFLVTSVIVNSKLFLLLWIGQNFVENSSNLLILHIITFGLAAILAVSWQMTEGLGFPRYNVRIFSLCLIVSIPLMFALINNYGNIGVAVARLAGYAVIFFGVFFIEKSFFLKVQTRFWIRLAGNLTIAAIAAAALEYLVSANFSSNWLTFVLSVISGGSAYCFVLWLLDFITVDEKLLIKRVFSR